MSIFKTECKQFILKKTSPPRRPGEEGVRFVFTWLESFCFCLYCRKWRNPGLNVVNTTSTTFVHSVLIDKHCGIQRQPMHCLKKKEKQDGADMCQAKFHLGQIVEAAFKLTQGAHPKNKLFVPPPLNFGSKYRYQSPDTVPRFVFQYYQD